MYATLNLMYSKLLKIRECGIGAYSRIKVNGEWLQHFWSFFEMLILNGNAENRQDIMRRRTFEIISRL